jgi:hypothetical protein
LKNLAKLFLVAGIGLSSLSIFNCQKIPEIKESAKRDSASGIRCEIDPYKFIPRKSPVEIVTIDTGHGLMGGVWYNKTYKTPKDYQNKLKEYKGKIPSDEVFLDINKDGILDLSAEEFDRLYNQYLEVQKLEKAGL